VIVLSLVVFSLEGSRLRCLRRADRHLARPNHVVLELRARLGVGLGV
jgi:hypothetical protein